MEALEGGVGCAEDAVDLGDGLGRGLEGLGLYLLDGCVMGLLDLCLLPKGGLVRHWIGGWTSMGTNDVAADGGLRTRSSVSSLISLR